MSKELKIQIAVAQSAARKRFRNKSISWTGFVDKLSDPQRTHETYKEYMAMTKGEQSNIKDVGGYVAGYLADGIRNKTSVVSRSMLTLDLDFAPYGIEDDITAFIGCEYVLHSTHKHSKDNPRYRLIIPLSTEVTREQYEPIARKVAELLDIEYFDKTTFQTERLMFWPSCSKDGEYIFIHNEGDFLDPEDILNEYVDWKNISEWPYHSDVDILIDERTGKKQENPTEKRGVVGMFCRTYDIHEAIQEFLSEEYTPEENNRYTYTKGSTASGAVVYDDMFLYSNHATDPAACQLCNSFDLVRLHKFGHLDRGEVSTGSNTKSYKEMERFVLELPEVRRIALEESKRAVLGDFDLFPNREAQTKEKSPENALKAANTEDIEDAEEVETEEITESTEWLSKLEVLPSGFPKPTDANITVIFRNDPALKGMFIYDEMENRRYVKKGIIWRTLKKDCEPFRDVDYSGLRNYFGITYEISSPTKIEDVLSLTFENNRFHPVRDFLEAQTWDGVERLDTLLTDVMGVEDNLYVREAIRKSLCAAVARVYEPGKKWDMVLTLVGETEGTGKSTFFRLLGGRWFSDSFYTVQGKEAAEQIQGKWIIEMAELSGMRKADVEAVKHFITKQCDYYRAAYGRTTDEYPRQCVFFATTNTREFLQQGQNRRFLPVEVNPEFAIVDVFSKEFEDMIPQIWAEAVKRYKDGEFLDLSREAKEIAFSTRKEFEEVDERIGLVQEFVNMPLPIQWKSWGITARRQHVQDYLHMLPEERPKEGERRTKVTNIEIWCELFGKSKEDFDKRQYRDQRQLLNNLPGWTRGNGLICLQCYGRQRYYYRT